MADTPDSDRVSDVCEWVLVFLVDEDEDPFVKLPLLNSTELKKHLRYGINDELRFKDVNIAVCAGFTVILRPFAGLPEEFQTAGPSGAQASPQGWEQYKDPKEEGQIPILEEGVNYTTTELIKIIKENLPFTCNLHINQICEASLGYAAFMEVLRDVVHEVKITTVDKDLARLLVATFFSNDYIYRQELIIPVIKCKRI